MDLDLILIWILILERLDALVRREPFGFHVLWFSPGWEMEALLLQALLGCLGNDGHYLLEPVGFSDEDGRQRLEDGPVVLCGPCDLEFRPEVDVHQ